MNLFNIVDLNIGLDCPEWVIHDRFSAFRSSSSILDLHFRVTFNAAPTPPADKTTLLLNAYADTYVDRNGYIHIQNFSKTDIPNYTAVSGDWSDGTLYIDPCYDNQGNLENADHVRTCLFSNIREVIIPSLIANDGVLIHAASIAYNGKGVLFSAPSGTGKTTHVRLWKERYNIQVLDGDVTACRILDGTSYAYGLPWCGTSEEFSNTRLPLKAVVFLEQSDKNEVSKLDFAEAIVRLYARCFLYLGGETMTDQVLKTLHSLVSRSDCYLLKCRPDFEAVELVKKCLEND